MKVMIGLPPPMAGDAMAPSLQNLFRIFLRIGLLSFGGPAAQISLMHRTLVDEQGWLSEKEFLNALSFCMLLPGPEAMQLATYAGWKLRGLSGGLIAGLLFVIPGALVIFALAGIYTTFGQVPLIESLFLGVKAAVLIIVLEALLKVSKRALKEPLHWWLAAASFVLIFFFSLPFPLLIFVAALIGATVATSGDTDKGSSINRPGFAPALKTIAIGLTIWLLPLFAVGALTGPPLLAEVGVFFSKLAVVTFGGAYAVLAYMAQDVVTAKEWLTAGQMMDGLGLAETTPGPLILVTQFVGFLAGFANGGIPLAIAAACVTLWATFVPCFLWIFAGAPYIDWIAAQPRLSGALKCITAAVVGVILNLSVWFTLHVVFSSVSLVNKGPLTLWTPDIASLDWRVPVLATLSGVLLLYRHMALGWVLLIAAVGGVLLSAL